MFHVEHLFVAVQHEPPYSIAFHVKPGVASRKFLTPTILRYYRDRTQPAMEFYKCLNYMML